MADNVDITPGAGATIATDEVAGAHLQRVKCDWGADGATSPATGDAGNGLDVDVTRVQGNVTVVQSSAANLKVDASGVAVPVTDNSTSLTVDAPVGTPAFVRLSDGAVAVPSDVTNGLDVDVTRVQGNVTVVQSSAANLKVDASGVAVPVTDNAASLTVDAPVGTPAFVRLSDGAAPIAALPVTDNNTTLSVDDGASSLTVDGTVAAVGDVAHDGADSGNPVKVGHKAIAHGTNPTAVAAGDRTDWYANRAGIPFSLGGHPNIVSLEAAYTGAQTDAAIITVGAGSKIVVTQIQAVVDQATTVGVGLRVGFGAANTPTTTGVVLTHPGMVPGSGISRGDGSGILGIGADGEDLRITSGVPTTGSLRILVSYFTIES